MGRSQTAPIVGSQDALDIERARRARDAAIGTPDQAEMQRQLEAVVARVKQSGGAR